METNKKYMVVQIGCIECGTEKEVDMISLKNGRSTQCMSCAGKNKGKKKNASII